MPNQRILLSVVILSAVLTACADSGKPTADTVIRSDSAGVAVVFSDTERLMDTCTLSAGPSLSIGVADGDEPYMFYRIFGAVTLEDGRIAVANQGSQEVRLFDSTGTWIGSMGREGHGPGEFERMFHLWQVRGNELWVGDFRPWEYEVFDINGNFLRQVSPTPQYSNSPERFGVLADGRSIQAETVNLRRDFERVTLAFMLHDDDGALIDTLFTAPDGRWGEVDTGSIKIVLYPLFESFAEFDLRGNRVAVGVGDKPEVTIRHADQNFEPVLILRWSTTDRTIRNADIEALHNEYRADYTDQTVDINRQILAALTHEDRPVADRKPAFSTVKLGVDEFIWVEPFDVGLGTDSSNWMRFGPDGVFTCHVSLPSELTVYEFGSDYILGKMADENDTERVVVYTLDI